MPPIPPVYHSFDGLPFGHPRDFLMERLCFSYAFLTLRWYTTDAILGEEVSAMTDLVRWNPYREMLALHDSIDRLFADAFSPTPWSGSWGAGTLAVDMYETDKALVVKAALPGVSEDDIDVQVRGDVLTIKAESKAEEEEERFGWHIRERRYGVWQRTLRLPVEVKGGKAKAELENGILTITLPKSESVLDAIKIKVQKVLPKVSLPRLKK